MITLLDGLQFLLFCLLLGRLSDRSHVEAVVFRARVLFIVLAQWFQAAEVSVPDVWEKTFYFDLFDI